MKPARATPEWIEKFTKEVSRYVLKGNYREGLVIAKAALKKYPAELDCRYQYAKLLGDWADELPPAKRKKLKAEAAGILRKLTRRLSGQGIAKRFGICLNYYYQTYSFAEMFRFGKRFKAHDRRKGWYAQALGAGLVAEKKLQESRPRSAKAWARKSAVAWKKYGLRGERYYFAHYSLAKSLAIAGDPRAALQSLKAAARLSGRPTSNWEFKDACELIQRQLK